MAKKVAATEPTPVQNPAAIIAIIGFVIDRAEKGFPLIRRWLKKDDAKVEIMRVAEGVDFGDAPAVDAAPAEVTQYLIQALTKIKNSTSGVAAKFALTVLINTIPLVTDSAWDWLFKNGTEPVIFGADFGSQGNDPVAEGFAAINSDS